MSTTHTLDQYISQFQNPTNLIDKLQEYGAQTGQFSAGWNESASFAKSLGLLPTELSAVPKTSDYGYNQKFNQWWGKLKSDPTQLSAALAKAGYGDAAAITKFATDYYHYKVGLPSNYGSLPNSTTPTMSTTPAPSAPSSSGNGYTANDRNDGYYDLYYNGSYLQKVSPSTLSSYGVKTPTAGSPAPAPSAGAPAAAAPAASVNTYGLTPTSPKWYWIQPGEGLDAYNQRIAAFNPNLPAPGTTSKTGVVNNATPASAIYAGARTPTPTAGTGGELATNVSNAIGSTVPSSVFASAGDTASISARANDLYKTYQDYLGKLMDASQPSKDELAVRSQIRDLNTKLAQGITGINGQTIPQPLIGMQGQKLNEQVASVIRPLQDEVDALVQSRGAQVSAIQSVLQATPELMQMLGNIQKLTQPNVLGTQVDQQTGDVYAIVQDGNGGIGVQKAGSIGMGSAKTYVQSGMYSTASGEYFYGVKSDGTIDNFKMQGATSGGAGSAGFTLSPGQVRYDSKGNPIAGTSTPAATFSTTQINKGAQNAAMSIADFQRLAPDDQNFFVNGFNDFTALKSLLDKGQLTPQQALDKINSSPFSPSVKSRLQTLLGVNAAPANSGSGVGNLLSWGWNAIKSTLFGI